MSTQSIAATSLKQLPLYGRKYQVQVLLPQADGSTQVLTVADSSFEPEALRVTFDIGMYWFKWIWYADIAIYNLDQFTTNQILGAQQKASDLSASPNTIQQGMKAIVSAGYQNDNGNYGIIWEGPIFQAWFERENVVDFKIILRCVLGLDETYRQTVNDTFGAVNLTQADVIKRIANSAFKGSTVNVSGKLSPNKLSRGKVIFGSPAKYFTEIAEDNNMQWFFDKTGLTLARIDDGDVAVKEPIVYIPQPQPGDTAPVPDGAIAGLIGVPAQTQYGCDFRVLMNSKIGIGRPATQIKIDLSSIVQLKKSIGEYPSILDQSGVYIVAGLHYRGDTRGQDWYVDVTGVSSVNGKLAMAKLAAANLNNG